jgi:hypothetical protein
MANPGKWWLGAPTVDYRGKLLCYTACGLDILKKCEIGEEV